jgi:hypothetical protein
MYIKTSNFMIPTKVLMQMLCSMGKQMDGPGILLEQNRH